jgi:hypothetical protein
VIGGVAGWLDRRGGDPAPAASVGTDTTTPPAAPPLATTTTPPPVVIPEIGEIDSGIVALGRRVVEITGETELGPLVALLPAGDGDPVERAAAQVRREFLDSRTVTVDGWVLAVSEARAAAVIALLCDEASC